MTICRSSKRCFGCGKTKPLAEFYPHPKMADGHLNKCKTCKRIDVTKHRLAHVDDVREYDRERSGEPHRVAARATYQKKLRAAKSPKLAARTAVANALRSGKLKRQPCEVCRAPKAEAHHDDYSKPLDVRWMCKIHHEQVHHALDGAAA